MTPITQNINRVSKVSASPNMVLNLRDPQMSNLHLAGIGGLALSLSCLQPTENIWWEIDSEEIRLYWTTTDKEAIEWLASATFQTDDNYMIYSPCFKDASPAQKYVYHDGFYNTFLGGSHAAMSPTTYQNTLRKNGGEKDFKKEKEDYATEGGYPFVVEEEKTIRYKRVSWYRHQLTNVATTPDEYQKAFTDKGNFFDDFKIITWLFPSSPIKHSANASSKLSQNKLQFVALLFAPVGCSYLKVLMQSRWLLVIPQVGDLMHFIKRKKRQIVNYQDYFVGGAASASLQETVADKGFFQNLNYCEVWSFEKLIWSDNQRVVSDRFFLNISDERLEKVAKDYATVENCFDYSLAGKIAKEVIYRNLINDLPWYLQLSNADIKKFTEIKQGIIRMLTNKTYTTIEETVFVGVVHWTIYNLSGQYQSIIKAKTKVAYNFGLQRAMSDNNFKKFWELLHNATRENACPLLKGKMFDVANFTGWVIQNWRQCKMLATVAINAYDNPIIGSHAVENWTYFLENGVIFEEDFDKIMQSRKVKLATKKKEHQEQEQLPLFLLEEE